MLCADMVQVRWRDQTGTDLHAMALLEDISPAGACLQLESPVPRDVEISWESPKRKFSGHVRYCVYREIGYFVGVEFDSGSRWSEKSFKPQHLLDLQQLLAGAKNNP